MAEADLTMGAGRRFMAGLAVEAAERFALRSSALPKSWAGDIADIKVSGWTLGSFPVHELE